jgi:hypothetical protein
MFCRELYWALEQDMLGYNCSKGIAKRFARCLPCAVGKPGKCGSGSASWFCRRRLSVFDTRGTLLADKSQALLRYGEQKLHVHHMRGPVKLLSVAVSFLCVQRYDLTAA